MSFTAAEAQRAITELYVGIFNRAPDPEGLAYWTDKLVIDGADIDEVRAAFVSSIEWQDGVGQSTNAQVVFHLYESLFERQPEPEGLEFWVTALDEGRVTVDEIVKNLIDAASAYDQLTLDNKVDAAIYYTTESGGPDMVNDAGFNGAAATQAVDNVDYTAESLEASYAATDRALEDSGSVFALTEADDEIVEGTQYNDIIRGALNETLNGFDTIDAGDGDDTLEVVVRAGDGNTLGIPGFVDVQGVETLTLDIVNGGIDVELVGGDNFDDALNTVNVYSTGGTAENVRVEADVDQINIGMVRADDGSLTERGVIESEVFVDVVDEDDSDTDTSVAVATDLGAYITSTGDLAAVDVTADGENIESDSAPNNVVVTAEGDIASVTSVAGNDTVIESLDGNIGTVVATGSFEYINSDITVTATPDDPASEGGNITSVDATAHTGSVNVVARDDIDAVTGRGINGVSVNSYEGDIGSVVAPGWTVDGDAYQSSNVSVEADDGAVGSVVAEASVDVYVWASDDITLVDATAGDDVIVISTDGDIAAVDATAGDDVFVGAWGGMVDSVTAEAGADVDVLASDGVGTVTANAADDVYVDSWNGGVGSVTVEAGDYVSVTASDDIGSVTADAGGNVFIHSTNGAVDQVVADAVGSINVWAHNGIGSVEADSENGGVTVYAYETGDIGSVDASGTFVVVEATDGTIESVNASSSLYNVGVYSYGGAVGSVVADAEANVNVYASDDIGSVDAEAGGYIRVTSQNGDIDSVNAYASDDVYVRSYDGSVGTVVAETVNASADIDVYASDDITSVTAVSADDVRVVSYYGNIDTVNADASDEIYVNAQMGEIDSVTADAGYYVGVFASDDIGTVDATAGYYVDVISNNGDIGEVDLVTGEDGAYVYAGGSVGDVTASTGDDLRVIGEDGVNSVDAVAVGDGYADIWVTAFDGNIGEVVADASEDVGVWAYGGSISSVEAQAHSDIFVYASDDIDSVTAVADGEDGYVEVVSQHGDIGSVDAADSGTGAGIEIAAMHGSIGSVTVDSSDTVFVFASDDVDSIDGSAVSLQAIAMGAMGDVDVMLTAGEDELYTDSDWLDARVIGAESVGDVTVGMDTSDESLQLVVASLGTVDSVTANLGQTDYAQIDVHAQNDAAVTVALTSTSDTFVDLFVGSVFSDPDGTGPLTLDLSSNGANGDTAMQIDFASTDNLGSGSDEVSNLTTINFDGDSNVQMYLGSLSETLETYDGSAGTGDQVIWADIQPTSEQDISISTGSGADDVHLYFYESDDHGAVTVTTGEGNDTFENWDGYAATGSLTISTGAGSDSVEAWAGSDAVVDITTGDDDDYVGLYSAENDIPSRAGEPGTVAGAPLPGYVDVDITIDAGAGDDVVEIWANRDSIEGASIDMGDGMNTLRYDYHPYETPVWSDGDIERFNLDNVEGSVHTLGLAVDLDVSDDTTLDLTGVGGVSVLEIGEIELVEDSSAHGSTLTILGAAEDFTMVATNGDDIGDSTSNDSSFDSDVLRLSLDGVVNATIEADEVGIVLEADANTSLESLTVSSTDDYLDVGVVGFTGGLDVTLMSGSPGTDGGDAQLFAFGGEYGDISVTSSDDEAIVTIQAADTDGGVDVGDYVFSAETVTVSAMTAGDTDGIAGEEAELEIDGYTVANDDGEYTRGVADVTIGSASLTGDRNTDLDVFDLSDGSTVTIGSVDININTSDSTFNDGGVDIAFVQGADITLGDVDVDIMVGGEDAYNTFYVSITDADNSTVSVGNISVDQMVMSDADTNADHNDVDVLVWDSERSNIVIGDVTANLDGAGFLLDIDNNDNTNVTVGDVDVTGEDGTVRIDDMIATTDGNDVTVVIGDITMHDNENDAWSAGNAGGLQVNITDNTDDFTGGLVDISVGNITLSGSDSATIQVSHNHAETDLFDTPIVPIVGIQIEMGDVDIDLNSTNTGAICDAAMVAGLGVYGNDGANIQVGDVNAAMGSDAGYIGYWGDYADDNYETVYSRGDTTVAIGSDAGGFGYALTSVNNNLDSEITFGDYTVAIGASDGSGVGYGYASLAITDNEGSTIEFGDVTLTIDGTSDAGFANLIVADNTDTSVSFGDVVLDGASESTVHIGFNTDSVVEMGDVELGGVGRVIIQSNDGENTDAVVTIGNVTVTGEGSDEVDGSFELDLYWDGGLAITDNNYAEITVGSFTSTNTYTDADLIINNNDSSSVTVSDVSLADVDEVDVFIDYNDYATIFVSDVSVVNAGDVDISVDANDNSSVTLGNVFVSDGADNVWVDIDNNDNATVTVGTVTIQDLTDGNVDFDVTNHDSSTVTVSDVTVEGVGFVDFYIEDNDDSTISLGNVSVSDADGFVDYDFLDNDNSTVTAGDVMISDATGSIDHFVSYNDNADITLGSFTANNVSDGANFELYVTDNDNTQVIMGSISVMTSDGADFYIEDNDSSLIGSDDSTISLSTAYGNIDFDIEDNDATDVMFSDVTLSSTNGSVSVLLEGGNVVGEDQGSVELGDITITAAEDVDFDADGDSSGIFASMGTVELGNLDITVTGSAATDVVDIDANSVIGLEEITISGEADTVNIDLGDNGPIDTTVTATTLIDMSGMTNEAAVIDIDFVSDWGAANMSDDITIKFGEFASAYVETYINDSYDITDLDDLDGVRQTYVFEGSDIGDIMIEGFVAGFGAYRDVDIEGGPGTGNEDGRGPVDGGGGPGSDFVDYSTSNGDGLTQLRTDRLDFSQFEGVSSLDDLSFEYSDADDSVIITAADGQFDGRIIVTGAGVDSDNGDSDESIIDRVADSIIFG